MTLSQVFMPPSRQSLFKTPNMYRKSLITGKTYADDLHK